MRFSTSFSHHCLYLNEACVGCRQNRLWLVFCIASMLLVAYTISYKFLSCIPVYTNFILVLERMDYITPIPVFLAATNFCQQRTMRSLSSVVGSHPLAGSVLCAVVTAERCSRCTALTARRECVETAHKVTTRAISVGSWTLTMWPSKRSWLP